MEDVVNDGDVGSEQGDDNAEVIRLHPRPVGRLRVARKSMEQCGRQETYLKAETQKTSTASDPFSGQDTVIVETTVLVEQNP